MLLAPCRFAPDLIKGDMDSVRPEVRAYYEGLGVPVDRMTDQDTTDLMKCLHYVERHLAQTRAANGTCGSCGSVQAERIAAGKKGQEGAEAPAGPGPAWLEEGELQAPDHLVIVLGA